MATTETPTAHSGPSALELRAEESMRGISEMIRLRMTRSPAISQMEEWIETINVLLAAALKTPPAGARGAVADGEKFADWLAREMPSGTIIGNPYWWAPRIIRALEALTGKADGGDATGVLVCAEHGIRYRQGCIHCENDLADLEATQPAATGMGELPELPAVKHGMPYTATDYYTADQMHAYARQALAAQPAPGVDDLSMLVRRLALDIRALADEDVPGEKSRLSRANKAIDYLRRKGLDGSPLRDDIQPATPVSNLPGRLIELLNSMVERDGLAVANDSLATVSCLLEEVLAAIPCYRKVIGRTTIAMIVRDVCETEPADPERPDSVVITVQELENILEDRLGVILDE